jgi:hypothetical protein
MTDPGNSSSPDSTDPPEPDASHAGPPATPIDAALLKTAYNAFKKRWKLTRLDYESRIGKSPLSSGGKNAIVGITAPKEFPKAVWEELVKQGRIKRAGSGLYSMP